MALLLGTRSYYCSGFPVKNAPPSRTEISVRALTRALRRCGRLAAKAQLRARTQVRLCPKKAGIWEGAFQPK